MSRMMTDVTDFIYLFTTREAAFRLSFSRAANCHNCHPTVKSWKISSLCDDSSAGTQTRDRLGGLFSMLALPSPGFPRCAARPSTASEYRTHGKIGAFVCTVF